MTQCGQCYALQPSIDIQNIGQRGRTLREQFGEHRRGIMDKLTDISGVAEHFNRRDHSLSDTTMIPLEAVRQTRKFTTSTRTATHHSS